MHLTKIALLLSMLGGRKTQAQSWILKNAFSNFAVLLSLLGGRKTQAQTWTLKNALKHFALLLSMLGGRKTQAQTWTLKNAFKYFALLLSSCYSAAARTVFCRYSEGILKTFWRLELLFFWSERGLRLEPQHAGWNLNPNSYQPLAGHMR